MNVVEQMHAVDNPRHDVVDVIVLIDVHRDNDVWRVGIKCHDNGTHCAETQESRVQPPRSNFSRVDLPAVAEKSAS